MFIPKTHPRKWQDYLIWWILKILWEPFSKKRSHWWHWTETLYIPKQSIMVKGNRSAKPRSGFWNMLWQTNFGWKTVAVLKPNHDGWYRIGFVSGNTKHLCTRLLKGETGLLIGPENIQFFGISWPKGTEIQLEEVRKTRKYSAGVKII